MVILFSVFKDSVHVAGQCRVFSMLCPGPYGKRKLHMGFLLWHPFQKWISSSFCSKSIVCESQVLPKELLLLEILMESLVPN